MNFMISRDLLVTAIQLLQQAQHPNVPHQTVQAAINQLSHLPQLQEADESLNTEEDDGESGES